MFEEKREKPEELNDFAAEPQEVVSWYTPRSREGQEVVSYYVHSKPLPEKARHAAPAVKKKKSRRGLWIFLGVFAALLVIVVAAAVIASLGGGDETGRGDKDTELPEGGDASSIIIVGGEVETTIPTVKGEEGLRLQIEETRGAELTIQQVYAQVNPAVITVVADDEFGSSVGTGVLMTSDGYFLTNAHVIDGAKSCWIILATGVTYDAKLVGYDALQDLAVLKAEDAQDLPVAVFGNSDSMVVGDTVYAIGNPLGVELRGTLTDGIISAVNRDVELDGRTLTLLQTNAALNNGNSGGPLINACGQVIGINVMKMTNTDLRYEATVEGLGFALPISDMAFVVNDIIAYGYFRGTPTIGIMVVTKAGENGGTYVLIDSVVEGSGAEKAGLQAGDIILAADGESVSLTDDLLSVRRNHGVGDTVVLTVQRGEQVFDANVVLGSDRD
ncbi:MAG: PDZ domain-containing protein [Ruminococcaceae bacterium]|nr:PDZ domain-containing protein [Oscillospiraceae bacterium]